MTEKMIENRIKKLRDIEAVIKAVLRRFAQVLGVGVQIGDLAVKGRLHICDTQLRFRCHRIKQADLPVNAAPGTLVGHIIRRAQRVNVLLD